MGTKVIGHSHERASGRSRTTKARAVATATVFAMVAMLLPFGLATPANANTVGEGFTVTPSDLAFILKQIKIAEAHSAVLAAQGPGPSTDPVRCQSMLGTGPNQIESPLVSFGLRTVDGSCNNLQAGQATYGAADQTFPRLTNPVFKAAGDATAFGGSATSSYAQISGPVVDTEPRTISNLIVDQTSTNPAAVAAAGFPVRTQGNEGVVPCTTEPTTPGGTDGLPAGCVPAHETLDIPNVTTDVGLSPPFNSLFTIFGQFFDHGLDKITNGGNGTVFVTLKADDPLVTGGPDGIPGNGDEVATGTPMVLTRGTIKNAPDGVRNAPNTDTPFVDQSQTYTSHSSHQVFLRQYVDNSDGRPVTTGKFLSTPDGEGLATWAMIKTQARNVLGIELVDTDVNNIPMIEADPYGNFIPDTATGLPKIVLSNGSFLVGNRTSPVTIPANAVRIGTAFLNDIAHSAAPTPGGPDLDTVAGNSLDTPSPAGTYDNELLDLHAICGDGRCNENIALQAVHQVFHDEHDRLIDDIKNTLTTDDTTGAAGRLAEWKLALGADGWNGQRLFQAARFVTEMQYQHLVFEEFARKVQPAINPFEPFAFTQTDVNPAITAEFAHAVYRFGHSMLTDTIPRINTDGSHNDIDLLDGFLNPAAYYKNGSQTLSSADAAGSIIMGLSDQTGQEIDEFVVNTLRNNLLGLPLDLPALNMARARSEGVPPLNDVRRQIFGQTNDGQLKPYTDWIDFGQQLKHPESLVNFVAAYGTHDAITSQTTSAGRRTAADRIVNGTILPGPDGVLSDDPLTVCTDTNVPAGCDESADNVLPPTDSADFMFGTGDWVNSAGKTTTGVDNIDLWMGGLAERTNLFGGLLGSTFNYVFENQLTNLQNGDRFYYLARTPGMNLRAQLEGNSFAELVMRNTPSHTLKADPFATADCKFELDNITWPATSVGSSNKLITGAGSVQDDPASACDENEQLLRMADGTIRYRQTNTAMPSGINAQSVYNGKTGTVNDRMWGGNDNDTFWGGAGNDIIEGNDGADIALGGEGNDIITDLAGDDVPKGGPGNDAIDAGPGLDIIMAGDGHDFTNGGANSNEHFMGSGDDFAIGGQGIDAIFGDSGNDWEEGGDQPDLLIGDSSSFFFDDHNVPGHDILIGQGGDDDYDLEGGDDIGVAGPGVEKVAGAAGYDWEIGLGDPQAQDTDLAQVFVAGGVILPGVRDKFNEVEALSGGALNDTLRGDDVVPTAVGGGGFVGCDALDAAGVARISGLDTLITPAMRTVDPAAPGGIFANTSTHQCLLEGNVWGAGNILLGGAGSDLIEGRGADDIIDGDRYVNVRLSVRTDRANPASEIGSTDLMTGVAKTGNFGLGTSGMTLQQAVFAGLVNPGNIVAVRELLTSATPDTDVAVFSDVRTSYEITVADVAGEKVITVNHSGGTATDGIDTLRNVETLRFVGGDVATSTIIAPVAAAELSTTALAFGLRATGSSTTLPVVVTNGGNANLTVTGATIAPASGTGFSVASNGCTTPLVPLDTCTIQVAFAPGGSTTAQTATLNIASNAPGSPTSVSLTGQGQTAPSIQVATTLAFGLRATGSTTNLPLVVTNNGSAPLVVSGATLNPATGSGFTIVTNACSTVAPGATCTITVAFAPGASTAVRTATLNIAHNAAGTPTAVTLTGQGQAPAAQAVITLPATTDFGLRRVGTVRTQSVRLANTGNAPLTIGTFTTTGAFTVTRGNCPAAPATLAAGRSCNLSVSFQPTAVGPATGTLTVTGNAANSPRTVALTGTGR
jgi:Ca2+-binding RTX toxin-like protein